LPAGAGHDVDVDALGDIPSRGRGALAGLVVGVGVHVHEPQTGTRPSRGRGGSGGHGSDPRRPGLRPGGTMDPVTAPADLAARYGATSRSRRAWLIGLVGVVVAAFLGWLTWVIVVESSPPVNSDFLGFAVLDDNAAKAFVAVALEEGVDATCVVRAFADDHS